MKWASNVGYDIIEIIEEYESFEKGMIESEEGIIDRDLSFANIGKDRIALKDIQLWRKADYDRQRLDFPNEDYSWWSGDGLYFNKKNVFPGARLSIYVKHSRRIHD